MTKVIWRTSQNLSQISPRACDCDFCQQRHIEYVSDPHGALTIEARVPLTTQQQGSEQANFYTCSGCHDVLAAGCDIETGQIAALNARLLDNYHELSDAEPASPKHLSPEQKRKRWGMIWMPLTIKEMY